jgi:transcriptional repressor NrdR
VRCPFCSSSSTRIVDSRPSEAEVRRRRQCEECGERFTTYERVEAPPITVVKRDGSRQPFDRDKLLGSLNRASHKRDVDPRRLSLIVDGVEKEVRDKGGELSAHRIGELCLDGLRKLDRGAYLQFAGTLPDAARSGS